MSSEAGDRPLGPDAQEAEATGLDGFQGGRAWGQAGQGSQAAVPWWAWLTAGRWLWLPAAAFLGTRLLIGVVIIVAGQIVVDWPIPPPYHIVPHNIILDSLGSRWDTGFYLSIANEGYRYQGVETPSVAFFPLLPLLMRAVGRLTGGDALLAGVIIANVALLGASVLLYRLAELEWGPAVAGRATLYFLIFPASFFGSAIYTESLFLFFAIGSLYLARRGVWEGAALLGVGASLTRLMGLLVAPLLLVEWWQQRRTRPAGERPAAAALLAAFIAPLGTLLYMAYLNDAFGDPLAFFHASAAWQREPESPLVLFSELLRRPEIGWFKGLLGGLIHLDNWIDFGFVLAFFGLGVALLVKRRWSEGLFVLLGLAVMLSSGLWNSQRRYVWALFPAFILLAQWGRRPWLDRLVVGASAAGLALFTALFANWYWVG